MTDWRQIQARIRKAKNSPDALSRLSELFQRTRDGMVAWELGAIEEKSERISEAAKWYGVAVERFRRAEWKKKAEEALARLGVPVPASAPLADSDESRHNHAHSHSSDTDSDTGPLHSSGEDSAEGSDEEPEDSQLAMMPQLVSAENRGQASGGTASASVSASQAAPDSPGNDQQKRKRRRGRRGGRGRRRKDASSAPGLPNQAFAESVESHSPAQSQGRSSAPKSELSAPLPFRQPEPRTASAEHTESSERSMPEPSRPAPVELPVPVPQVPAHRTAHGRSGDPALASRMAHLESILRRLLSSPLHRLDDIEAAPAGPGVFLLSDSDQVTSYYIESCQTLRVGLGNLLRGGRGGKGNRGSGHGYSESGLKSKLAEHLGINEAKVNQYMKDHCVVRWIQLDDEAAHLAHFAIGVLRTPCNLE